MITATYNSEKHLPQLIESLQSQTNRNFEWIVVDGNSKDRTLEILNKIDNLNINILSESDFGIYDALNKGIHLSKGDYYLTVGSDDFFDKNAIDNYYKAIYKYGDKADMIAASVFIGDVKRQPRSGLGWLYGIQGIASCHSVGLLIKKSLHDRYGYYSNKFPIAADQLFVKTAYNAGATIKSEGFVAGFFSIYGLSANDHLGMLTEFFRVQMLTEKFKFLQLIIFILRLIKNIPKIIL